MRFLGAIGAARMAVPSRTFILSSAITRCAIASDIMVAMGAVSISLNANFLEWHNIDLVA